MAEPAETFLPLLRKMRAESAGGFGERIASPGDEVRELERFK
jgi:hypothetical protein